MNRVKEWLITHRVFFQGMGATAVLIVVLGFLADWLVMPLYTHHGEETEMPEITELSFTEASKYLKDRGFDIIIEKSIYDATYPESTVVLQNPAAYTKIKKGRRIYVTLSAGEKLVQVPHVIGRSERDAEFMLKQSGLLLGEVFYEYHDYHLKGVVSDQSMHTGLEVSENTPIDITVSLGREPSRFVVPSVIGKSLQEARKIILQSGLVVGSITYVIRREYIPDTVISQSVDPGNHVAQGSAIDLVVSRLEEYGNL